jgi:saccharopepsin
MKSFALLTASALLCTASAEVHKLKLGKVPLEQQFVGRLIPGEGSRL